MPARESRPALIERLRGLLQSTNLAPEDVPALLAEIKAKGLEKKLKADIRRLMLRAFGGSITQSDLKARRAVPPPPEPEPNPLDDIVDDDDITQQVQDEADELASHAAPRNVPTSELPLADQARRVASSFDANTTGAAQRIMDELVEAGIITEEVAKTATPKTIKGILDRINTTGMAGLPRFRDQAGVGTAITALKEAWNGIANKTGKSFDEYPDDVLAALEQVKTSVLQSKALSANRGTKATGGTTPVKKGPVLGVGPEHAAFKEGILNRLKDAGFFREGVDIPKTAETSTTDTLRVLAEGYPEGTPVRQALEELAEGTENLAARTGVPTSVQTDALERMFEKVKTSKVEWDKSNDPKVQADIAAEAEKATAAKAATEAAENAATIKPPTRTEKVLGGMKSFMGGLVKEEGRELAAGGKALLSGGIGSRAMGLGRLMSTTFTAPAAFGALAAGPLGSTLDTITQARSIPEAPSTEAIIASMRAKEIQMRRLREVLGGNPAVQQALQKQMAGRRMVQSGRVPGEIEIGGEPGAGPFENPEALMALMNG